MFVVKRPQCLPGCSAVRVLGCAEVMKARCELGACSAWWGFSADSHHPGELHVDAEKAMAPHSSTLAWKIPWMEEPGRL